MNVTPSASDRKASPKTTYRPTVGESNSSSQNDEDQDGNAGEIDISGDYGDEDRNDDEESDMSNNSKSVNSQTSKEVDIDDFRNYSKTRLDIGKDEDSTDYW